MGSGTGAIHVNIEGSQRSDSSLVDSCFETPGGRKAFSMPNGAKVQGNSTGGTCQAVTEDSSNKSENSGSGSGSTSSGPGNEDYETIKIPAGERRKVSISQGQTLKNKLYDVTADGAGITFLAFQDNFTMRNIGLKGENQAGEYMMRVETKNSTIENCYFGDGGADGVVGIYVGRLTDGLTINSCNISEGWSNGVYASDMGYPEKKSGAKPGRGELIVKNCYFKDNVVSHCRMGTSKSRAENCVVVGGPHRGFWAYWNEPTFVNCDASVGSGRSFESGEPVYDDVRENPVVMHLKDCAAPGGTDGLSVRGDADADVQNMGSNPRKEPPKGCPTSAEQAASGGGA
jgi:hypothetical protein